jgi:hypothetical protein
MNLNKWNFLFLSAKSALLRSLLHLLLNATSEILVNDVRCTGAD